MRVFGLLCVVLSFGCVYETNNYYVAAGDGGVNDMGYTDQFGDYHEEPGDRSIFKPGAKLQGNAQLILQEAAQPQVPNINWPRTALDVPWQRAAAATLIDVATRDEEPHVVTITLGDLAGPPPPGEPLNSPTEVVAILDLGIGGVPMVAEIDYVRGVQFSLAITRLQLHVVWRVVNGGNAIATVPLPYPVAASLATGAIAHGRQPQRTFTRRGLDPGDDESLYVPMFAKSFRMVSEPNNNQATVEMRDSAYGMTESVFNAVAYPTVDWPITSDQQTIRVVNHEPHSANYAFIFELAL